MAASALIHCEILASRRSTAADLADIVNVCALDLGLKVRTKQHVGGIRPKKSILTLHLPVEVAAQQSPFWCLACRLACFCPTTRVSILVHSENSFSHPALPQKRLQSA